MNYINKVNKFCNYKFLVEFTNQKYLSEYEFTANGNEIKFAVHPIEAALSLFPELAMITTDAAPSSDSERMAVRIDMLSIDYYIVYLQQGFNYIPFEILDRYGKDTVSDEIKNLYFSHNPFKFKQLYEAGFKDTELIVEKIDLIRSELDDDVSYISLNDDDSVFLFRMNEDGMFIPEKIQAKKNQQVKAG